MQGGIIATAARQQQQPEVRLIRWPMLTHMLTPKEAGMQSGNRARAVIAALLFLLVSGFVSGQAPAGAQRPIPPPWPSEREKQDEPSGPPMKAILKSQHEQMKKDVDHLLQLATELKAEVDKTNSDILSLKVIKKAEEIEKLAKKIQNRMKG